MNGVLQWVKRIVVGYAIGAGAVAPGLSGGALAVVFGIYQRITDALAHFFEDVRGNVRFLLPLGIGGALAVTSLGRALEYCFSSYPSVTKTVFLGLMAGTLPSIVKSAGQEGRKWYYPLLAAMTFGAGTWLFSATHAVTVMRSLSFAEAAFCGAVLGFGTVVPGVSSSFLLLSMGYYEAVLEIIGGKDLSGLLPLGIGFAVSVAVLLRVVDVLYKKAYGAMSHAVLGLVFSSIIPVIPPLSPDAPSCLLSVLLILCAVLSYVGMRWMHGGRKRR